MMMYQKMHSSESAMVARSDTMMRMSVRIHYSSSFFCFCFVAFVLNPDCSFFEKGFLLLV